MDDDLKRFIRAECVPRRCSFCGRRTAPTAALSDVAAFISERMGMFYGRAVDQPPMTVAKTDTRAGTPIPKSCSLTRSDWSFRGTLMAASSAHLEEIGDDAWSKFDLAPA